MAKRKRSKTKQYYSRTTTLKRTGISQYDRDLIVELAAEGSYQPHAFCDLAEYGKFGSCAQFKKLVAAKKRRLAVEKRARQRVQDKITFSWEQ